MLRTTLLTALGLLLILGPNANAQPAPSNERYAPGVVLVKFAPETLPEIRPSLTAADLVPASAARQALGQARFTGGTKLFRDFVPQDTLATSKRGETVHLKDLSRWYRLEVAPGTEVEALVEKLRAAPGVLSASPDYFMRYDDVFPDDPEFEVDRQWGLYNFQTPGNDIHAPQAWDLQTGRSDVVVAIIDSGVDYDHHDLDPSDRSRVIAGRDFANNDNDPDDDSCGPNGHGTKVAGATGAMTNNDRDVAGVMWNLQIMPLKVNTSTLPCSAQEPRISFIAEALDYARSNGADIANISSSYPDGDDGITDVEVLLEPLTNAWRAGMLVVASAGNDGEDEVNAPARYHMVMGVGATNRLDQRTSFSSYGLALDVVAPGTGHWSTEPGGGTDEFGGTSLSAPLTAGVAGLLLSESRDRNLGLTNDDIREIIRRTANDVNAGQHPGFDQFVGHGRVNAYEALRLVQAPNTVTTRTRTGGTSELTWDNHDHDFFGYEGGPLAHGRYYGVRQYRVSGHVSFSQTYQTPPEVWARLSSIKGWSEHNPNAQIPEVTITNVTTSGFDYETYVYWITSDIQGQSVNQYFPVSPSQVRAEFTILGEPDPVPPLSVEIDGPGYVQPTQMYTWTRDVSGGQSPYSYAWSSRYVCPDTPPCPTYPNCIGTLSMGPTCGDWGSLGTGYSATRAFSPFYDQAEIRLEVTDDAGSVETTIQPITIASSRPAGAGTTADAARGTANAEATAARGASVSLPEAYALDGAVPNPFRGAASVGFALPEAAEVRLAVYDLLGREVVVLAEGRVEAGYHRARFDGSGLPSGVYVVRFVAGDFVETARMTLLR